MYEERMKKAIAAIKKGEMIIIMDDEDRENEGDLVMAGIFSTPEKINFMAQEARGLICVSITQELAHKLELPPMVRHNDSNHETAFTISIDAKAAKTGISAYERDMTIRLMCENNAKPSDFVRPGHIFPLIAKNGGVLVRTGHTEASVDICKLAGLAPISVICEIMKKDGSMARRGDKFLLDFAREHHLEILYVSDIIHYRLNVENLVREIGREEACFMDINCEKIRFIDHARREHVVFHFPTHNASPNSAPLIRFHNTSSDIALLQHASEWQALKKSLSFLSTQGGYLICLDIYLSEHTAHMCNLSALDANNPQYSMRTISQLAHTKSCGDMKDFGIGAQILKRLAINEFILLSSCGANKGEYSALSGFDLRLLQTIEL